jgi:FtsZ-binding cell division protein ZapB
MAKVAVGAVAVKEGFEFGYEAGTKLRNVLNDLTDGGFDRFIQQVTGFRAFADWVTGADAASDASQRLEANLKILAAAGFDTVGLSAEQAQRKVEEYYRAKGDAAGAERAATEAAREFAEALGESKEQLDAQAEALLKSIDSLERTGQALNSVQVGTLSDQLQALLGKYSEIGQEAPAAFGAAAAAVEDMAQRMAAATQKGKHELEALEGQMVSFPGAATDMASSTIKIVEAFDEAGRKVLLVTNRLTEAGQEIESIKLTEEGVFTNLGEGAKKAAEGTVKVIESVDEAGNVIKTVVNVAGEAAKALEGTGRGGEAGAKGIDAITKATAELTTKQAEAQKALAETAKALEGIAGASAGNIAVAFAGIAETVKVAFGGVIGFEAPILAGLDRVIAKSAECEAAIERVKKAVEGAVG